MNLANTLVEEPGSVEFRAGPAFPSLRLVFGLTVKKWRKQIGLSQDELARRSGLHRTYLCDVERGTRNISIDCMQKLAIALQVNLAQLFPDDYLNERPNKDPDRDINYLLGVVRDINGARSVLDDLRVSHPRIRIEMSSAVGRVAKVVSTTRNPLQAHNAGSPLIPDLILLEGELAGCKEFVRGASTNPSPIPIIILADSDVARDSFIRWKKGAAGYLVKPLRLQDLKNMASQLGLSLP